MCNMLKCIKAHEMLKKRSINLKVRQVVCEKWQDEYSSMKGAWTEAGSTHCS
jgi:hypothetical protein